jgi:hypothetical protein
LDFACIDRPRRRPAGGPSPQVREGEKEADGAGADLVEPTWSAMQAQERGRPGSPGSNGTRQPRGAGERWRAGKCVYHRWLEEVKGNSFHGLDLRGEV